MGEGHRDLRTGNFKKTTIRERPGTTLVGLILLGSAILSPAQNLGLGTGSRSSSTSDSTTQSQAVQGQGRGSAYDHQEEAPPRKSQLNKRLGLTGRKGGQFDPKQFEARGRELQGQFYEIGGSANNPTKWPTSSSSSSDITLAKQNNGSRQWLFWVGIAGVAGASAGTVGYIMMGKAHPSPPPAKELVLSDE
jgi:hypothetical protein